ncbi:hypothetical protein Acr_10g0008960 [Actinidia rufa]|uniref:Uncharacterized protein n=1 Tax=Actinidia rufa TaxID=165716 RepID=A0A7J0FA26_9ERIC|nr:hypothetical protein Acr_10g0008960 [Actinidia rufa]
MKYSKGDGGCGSDTEWMAVVGALVEVMVVAVRRGSSNGDGVSGGGSDGKVTDERKGVMTATVTGVTDGSCIC